MQLLSTDIAAHQVQVREGGRVYQAKGGVLEVDDPKDAKIMRLAGCSARFAQAVGGLTFVCPHCGFRAYFKDRCGRCGATDLEEEL